MIPSGRASRPTHGRDDQPDCPTSAGCAKVAVPHHSHEAITRSASVLPRVARQCVLKCFTNLATDCRLIPTCLLPPSTSFLLPRPTGFSLVSSDLLVHSWL